MSELNKTFLGLGGGSEERFYIRMVQTAMTHKRYRYKTLVSSNGSPRHKNIDTWKPGTKRSFTALVRDLKKQVRNKSIRELAVYLLSHGEKTGCAELPTGCWKYSSLTRLLNRLPAKQRIITNGHCYSGKMALFALKQAGTLFVSSASSELTSASTVAQKSRYNVSFSLRFYAPASTIKARGGDQDGNGQISYWERFQYAKRHSLIRRSFPVFIAYGYTDRGIEAHPVRANPPFSKTVITVNSADQLARERQAADKGRVAVVLYSDGSRISNKHEVLMKKLASASGGHVKFIVAKLNGESRETLKRDGIMFPSMMLVTGLRRHTVKNMRKPMHEIGYLARLSAPLLANALWDPSRAIRARAARHFNPDWPEAIAALTKALTRPGKWSGGELNPRRVAAKLLGRTGKRAVPEIIQALHHNDPNIRRAAVEAAAEIKDKSLLPHLIAAAEDSDIGVILKTAVALEMYKSLDISYPLFAARAKLAVRLQSLWNDRNGLVAAQQSIKSLELDNHALPLLRWIHRKSKIRENRIHALAALASIKKSQIPWKYYVKALKTSHREGWSGLAKESLARVFVNLAANGSIPKGTDANIAIRNACLGAQTFSTTDKLFSTLLRRGALASAKLVLSQANKNNWKIDYASGMALIKLLEKGNFSLAPE